MRGAAHSARLQREEEEHNTRLQREEEHIARLQREEVQIAPQQEEQEEHTATEEVHIARLQREGDRGEAAKLIGRQGSMLRAVTHEMREERR